MKIGIFGGTFNPIHVGHLLLAEQAREAAALDTVVFMPAHVSPFKIGAATETGEQRYEMVRLAVADNPYFSVSDLEIKAAEVSYTINTLKQCRALYGEGAELWLILGTDAFLDMDRWYQAEEILRNYPILVGNRPGRREMELIDCMWRFKERFGSRVQRVDMPRQDISSTDIRQRAAEGKTIKYLVPEAVKQYISTYKLYGASNSGGN